MKTKKELLERIKELEKRPEDNVTIKDCHIQQDIVFDSRTLDTIHTIAVGLSRNAQALGHLAKVLSNDRIEPVAINIGIKQM